MERKNNKIYPIGIFDSGLGGLEILKQIVKKLPQYDYVYLGDTARFPYGQRSQEAIYKFTEQAVDFLFKRNCQLVILACNTASSEAVRKIQQEYLFKHYPERRVLGVIIPAAEAAIKKTKNKRIGIMATEGTVASGAFKREILKLNPGIKIFQQACPLLAPIIEAGEKDPLICSLAIEKYLKPLIGKKIDTLVLGCTHYGFLAEKIKKFAGPDINVIVEGGVVSEKLSDYLSRHSEIENKLSQNAKREFLTTDLTGKFKKLGSKFFGQGIAPQRVDLV